MHRLHGGHSQGTAERPGLVPQALEHIFRQLPGTAGPNSGDSSSVNGGHSVRVMVSAYEVRRVPVVCLGLVDAASNPNLASAKWKCCTKHAGPATNGHSSALWPLLPSWRLLRIACSGSTCQCAPLLPKTQIYNEVVYDLLALATSTAGPACAAAAASRPALRLTEERGHITVVGSVEVSWAQALEHAPANAFS